VQVLVFSARQHNAKHVIYSRPSICTAVCPSVRPSITRVDHSTRKLSYHKDDRAMPLYIGALKIFGESLSTPTATFAEIFNGLLFKWTLWMYGPNLQSVALPVP